MKNRNNSSRRLKRDSFFFESPPGHETSNLQAQASWNAAERRVYPPRWYECSGVVSAYSNGLYFTSLNPSSGKEYDNFIGWDNFHLIDIDSKYKEFTLVFKCKGESERRYKILAGTRKVENNQGSFEQWLNLFTVVERL